MSALSSAERNLTASTFCWDHYHSQCETQTTCKCVCHRYDRLRKIADNAINLISTDSVSNRSSVDSLRRQLAALDGEVKK